MGLKLFQRDRNNVHTACGRDPSAPHHLRDAALLRSRMIRQQKQCSRRELRAEGALGVRDSNELFGTTAQVQGEKHLELALGTEPTQARQMDPTKNYNN